MSTCWKCGRELPAGKTECDYGCGEGPADTTEHDASMADFKTNWMQVDFTKVKTLAELLMILSVHADPVFVPKDSPKFPLLRKYLKPIE